MMPGKGNHVAVLCTMIGDDGQTIAGGEAILSQIPLAVWASLVSDELVVGSWRNGRESPAHDLQVHCTRGGKILPTDISELSVRLAMPKATIYRFLQTIKSLGEEIPCMR